MVHAHSELDTSGDVESNWSLKGRTSKSPLLILRFTKPSECLVLIEFDTPSQGILVDQILWAQGLYLQPGRPGERLITTMDNPRILGELPTNDAFREVFRPIHEKAIYRRFRSGGMTRAAAKRATGSFLKEWRDVFQRRMSFRASADYLESSSPTPDDHSD